MAVRDNVLVRRAKALILHWSGSELVFENYLTKRQVRANPLLADLLSELEGWKSVAFIKRRFSGASFAGWNEVIASLIKQNILLVKASKEAKQDDALDSWEWDHSARYFHFATKDGDYSFDPSNERKFFKHLAAKEPPPSHYKDYPGKFIPLPQVAPINNQDLLRTLYARRTRRWFLSKPISIQSLSALLQHTWGKTDSVDTGILDKRIIRTSPSGGCRHPIETYLVALRIPGVPAGFYHYSVRRHGLELLREGVNDSWVIKACSGQKWIRGAAAFFVMTGVFPRTMWRYRFSRAYRVVQIEAGHFGQTFQLIATALGLDSFITAALQDNFIEQSLEIDGISESALYAMAVGHAKATTDIVRRRSLTPTSERTPKRLMR